MVVPIKLASRIRRTGGAPVCDFIIFPTQYWPARAPLAQFNPSHGRAYGRRELRPAPAMILTLMMLGRPAWNRWRPTMARGPTVIAMIAVIAASRRRDVVAAAPHAGSGNVRFKAPAAAPPPHRATAPRAYHTHTGGDQAEQQQSDDTDLPR